MDAFLRMSSTPCSSAHDTTENSLNEERPSKRQKVAGRGNGGQSHHDVVALNRDMDERGKKDFGIIAGELLDLNEHMVHDPPYSEENPDSNNSELLPVYRSSIYVDAFNLALDTVLEQESHLFSDEEATIFAAWRDLDYEAQYVYVRLFLRKQCIWHRTQKLRYRMDVSDMGAAISSLKKQRSLSSHKVLNTENLPSADDDSASRDCAIRENSTFVFLEASEDFVANASEAATLLSLDELKTVAKEVKVKGTTKAQLQTALVDMSMKQSTLAFIDPRHCSNLQSLRLEDGSKTRQARSPEKDMLTLERRLFLTIKGITGPCVRVSSITFQLFERVHLVYYRTWEWTEKSLTTIILAKMSKRNFVEYAVSRTSNIFESRQQLLEFEEALQLEFKVDNMLEAGTSPTADTFSEVVLCFDRISNRWRRLIDGQNCTSQPEQLQDGGYHRRFCAAHVLTRVAHKAAYALGRLHRYSQEHALLTELLHQRLYHTARRGAWYQRKALLEELYMSTALSGDDTKNLQNNKTSWYRKAAATCEQALQDPSCHLIYHHDLRKRLVKLEMRLRIPRRLQHDFRHLQLLAPEQHAFEGIQIRPKSGIAGDAKPYGSRKTIWLDESGEGLECSVENMCLNHYRKQGWNGLHSEGGIIRTLYAYLFFDILFLYVPNVFQTAYQTCPLDLFTDGYYAARASEVNRRLVEISNGEAEKIVRSIHASQIERRPCVIGLNWDFPLEDVAEVARCFNGNALAAVCKVLTEEYRQRTGGLPDLLLWRLEPPEILFSEVKSANDRLSDTQRLWIHVLLEAGAKVALCNAIAGEVRAK